MVPTPFPFHSRVKKRPSASTFSICTQLLLPIISMLLASLPPLAAAQQQYEANAQTDCYGTNGSSVLGYTCSSSSKNAPRSCTAYLAFRSAPPYSSPVAVSYLLNASAEAVAAANAARASYPVAASRLLLVPVPCTCTAAGRYQHDAAYVIQFDYETYLTMANDTFQGLTTCQALMAQNPAHDSMDLYPGISLRVPLRCACPSAAQAAAGVRYLVTYLLDWDDDSNTVAGRFHADYQAVLDANGLYDNSTVYPFTTMLVPLKDPPKPEALPLPEEAPSPASAPEAVSDKKPAASKSDKSGGGVKWRVMFGVGAGCGVLVSGAAFALFLLLWRCCRRRRGDRARKAVPSSNVSSSAAEGKAAATPSWRTTITTPASVDVRDAVASLITVYDYATLERATAGFAEENRVGSSSVYGAVIGDDAAAVKRVAGDVGAEVTVLGRVNHARLVRLCGLCVHRGDTHLVFEFAENGALGDWLHHLHGGEDAARVLGWRQRVQVALDVADGLNYLHNYASPPYVHKNLKTSNVLLGARLRAKVSGFGLARAAVASAQAQMMTRHVVGTEGYLAPEYLEHGLIGPHIDVFAFGVVLLELLSGKEAAPAARVVINDGKNGGEATLLLWQEAERLVVDDDGARDKVAAFVDARLREDYPQDVAFALLALALRCVAREPRTRPSMGEVFLSLSALYGSTSPCDLPARRWQDEASTVR